MSKKKLNATFTTGVNLSDERRFEKGDPVPEDIKQEDLEALVEMNAVEVK